MTVDLVVALIYKPLAPVRGGFLLGGDNTARLADRQTAENVAWREGYISSNFK
jgi:hypothetical protein